MSDISVLLWQTLQIIWINILLSGDNAVVIALACARLDDRRRRWAIAAGSVVAIALRVVFTVFVVELQKLPYVKLASGALLLWIAIQLLRESGEKEVTPASSIWGAVRTIAFADAVMSLDNVVAVAAAAHNSLPLIIFGIALSVPLIVFGASLMLTLLKRFPFLVVAGAALLGWVAGGMAASDPKLADWLGPLPGYAELVLAAAGASLILVVAGLLHWMRRGAGVEADRVR
jgi:YjbE family integral membrane protein